jgi:hypothetical protein
MAASRRQWEWTMSSAPSWALAFLCVLWVGLSGCSQPAPGISARDLEVTQAFARASVGASDTTAAYLTITNRGRTDDRLTGARCAAAAAVELHTMKMSGGMMHMRAAETAAVPAGGSVAFAPGGDHLMLIGLKTSLKAGDKLTLTLIFERAGEVTVEAEVRS